jgi:2-iminobutanoate/2-iminopropanoate deaminase
MKQISTLKAPKAVGPYSQAIEIDGLVFVSGQIPINPETGTIDAKNIEEETHQAIKNVGAILSQAGLSFDNVVKSTVFIKNINDFGKINQIYEGYFVSKPARSLVEVSNLPKGANIEIEVIAKK